MYLPALFRYTKIHLYFTKLIVKTNLSKANAKNFAVAIEVYLRQVVIKYINYLS